MIVFLKGVLEDWEFRDNRIELRESLVNGICRVMFLHPFYFCFISIFTFRASVAHTENVKLTLVLNIWTVHCWEIKKENFLIDGDVIPD